MYWEGLLHSAVKSIGWQHGSLGIHWDAGLGQQVEVFLQSSVPSFCHGALPQASESRDRMRVQALLDFGARAWATGTTAIVCHEDPWATGLFLGKHSCSLFEPHSLPSPLGFKCCTAQS